MAQPITITYTVNDGKVPARQSFVTINVTNPSTEMGFITAFAQDMGELIQAMITGQVGACSVNVPIVLTGMAASPGADSDIEEGAKFLFESVDGFKTNVRIPTFDEAKILAATETVILDDADVEAFVNAMLDGIDENPIGVGGDVYPATSHAERVTDLVYAVENFIKSRSRSRR